MGFSFGPLRRAGWPVLLGLIVGSFVSVVAAETGGAYRGKGAVAVVGITPREAERQARQAALREIVQRAGVTVSTAEVLANREYFGLTVVQSDAYRIVNVSCEISQELRRPEGDGKDLLWIEADCGGELVRLSDTLAKPVVRLVPESQALDCVVTDWERLESVDSFRRLEGYCLFAKSAQDVHLSVLSAFEDENGNLRFNRLTREASSPLLKAGEIFSSVRLMSDVPAGASESVEAFFLLASERPLLLDSIPYLGTSHDETLSENAGMDSLDLLLTEQVSPSEIRLVTLPYLVR